MKGRTTKWFSVLLLAVALMPAAQAQPRASEQPAGDAVQRAVVAPLPAAPAGGGREITYAAAALGSIRSVDLLQLGGEWEFLQQDWYNILNAGYRFAVRGTGFPGAGSAVEGQVTGREFLTYGPMLLLEVEGEKPGGQLERSRPGPHRMSARLRLQVQGTPVSEVELIVSGRVERRFEVPRDAAQGRWLDWTHDVTLPESSWIAARARSVASGLRVTAAHTNPVYIYLDGRAPFQREAVDAWIAKIDEQIAIHSVHADPESARVLNYFQLARDVLLKVRAAGGLGSDADPAPWIAELTALEPGLRSLALEAGVADATEEEIRAFLRPIPPPEPEEALRQFETVSGFTMQLVAAEPLVRSPIAAAFDEDGNLYVAEMTDYPYNPRGRVRVAWQREHAPDEEPQGSVRLLRDTNGDGVFDESYVFADNLLWVGGIVPWKGGVFVASPPDIWYLKDTTGDGKADVRERVFTGFGMDRQQQFVNSLQFGLDHKIYGSTGGNGGEIRPGDDPSAVPVSVHGRDFRFAPETRRLEVLTGTKQFGMSFDDWGNRFLCDQSNPGHHVVLPLHYLERNPHFTPRATIFTMTPSPTPLFRISPIERWRLIKSSRRFAGSERAGDIVPVPGLNFRPESSGARAATTAGVSNYVVDATAGITIYRGGAYPPEYYGSLFVGDSGSNVVHRRVLVPAGPTFRSERADPDTEFVRSSDNWFRPVNFVNAPDGTLYVIDMAREHSETANIPPDVEKHMDLQSGKDRGRIYRIAPADFQQPSPPRLSRASTAELVAALESPHGWWRDTAHRLLHERQDRSAVPDLERLLAESASAQARVHALWSLWGLGALSDAAILGGLGDSHPGVRENAVRLAEERLEESHAVREGVLNLVSDSGARVRLQVAFTIGESGKWDRAALLARMARENLDDSWIQAAVISSAADCGGGLFSNAARDPALLSRREGVEFLRQLAVAVGFQNRPAEVNQVLDALSGLDEPAASFPLLSALGEGLRLAGTDLRGVDAGGRADALLLQAPRAALDGRHPEAVRRAAAESLAILSFEEASPTLAGLLAPEQPAALQASAIGVVARFGREDAGALVVRHYSRLAASARTRAIDALLERTEWVAMLLDGVQRGSIARDHLSARQMAALRQHGDERVRERTADVFGAANPAARGDVVRAYLPALDLSGAIDRGRSIFQSRCAVCHQFAGTGLPFGPDLTGAGAAGREKLLSDILDPNRDVAPEYFLYTVETKSGERTSGMLRDQTAASVTLLQIGGVERVISRDNIARMQTVRRSMMPEGLESGLSPQDMADLIEYLTTAAP